MPTETHVFHATATVMAISVQPRAELAVCCGIELTNRLTLLAQLWTVVRLRLLQLVVKLS
jgi:hypothetical protein